MEFVHGWFVVSINTGKLGERHIAMHVLPWYDLKSSSGC